MKKQQNQELSTRLEAKGDEALFGGANTNDMKRKLGAPDSRPLADFLSTLAIKAKDFATEMTGHNVLEKDLRGTRSINDEHVASNKAVRNSMLQRGIEPEDLPPGEDVKKVERRLKSEAKQVKQGAKRLRPKK
jgi:DNA-damage-inducible protein D